MCVVLACPQRTQCKTVFFFKKSEKKPEDLYPIPNPVQFSIWGPFFG